uniref:NADH-ubiquinone oxidoreductase chain 2 n=1 Tax=Fusarium bambusae TaxID=2600298 RepID=A0A5B8HSN9_9HYPO|nr:NADH dehydrogenase subunit 2 [Fusarium bambusae]QDX17429.1 NADH dehydrogenase subunit 2 [Fusarium bambusae]
MIILSIVLVLLSNAVNIRRDLSILFNRISILILIYCILHDMSSLAVITKGVGLHGGLLLMSNITQIFHIFIFLVSILILQLTSFYPRKVWVSEYSSLKDLLLYKFIYYNTKIINKMGEHFKIIEYPLIILFVITGAVLLMSTNDLVSIFLAIELQSYGLYILSTIYRNSELSTTGGLIYFLLGGLSSCFILLGTSLLYANSGTTNLDGLYIITSISDLSANLWYTPYYINLSLVIFTIGFLFKVSAAPFHFWSPDVYDAIPTIVTTFVAIIAKISIFILLLQLVYYTNSSFSEMSWTFILLISSLFSLIIGTVVGLTQFRIKRLFAYSTISHVGFILLALGISSVESTQAFIFYLTQYSISNLNAFVILIAIGFSLYCYISENKEHEELMDKNNSPIQLVTQLKGYFYINPFLAISLAITIFSFVGVPPLIGFFGKQMVLSAALDKGLIFLSLIAILTSVIGGVYYLGIIKEMFFSLPEYKINPLLENLVLKGNVLDNNQKIINKLNFNYKNIAISSPISFVISIITLVILLFLFMNKEWLSMGKEKTIPFFNKINLINKSIRSFYRGWLTSFGWVKNTFFTRPRKLKLFVPPLKTYSRILINNYTTRRSFSMLIYSFSLLIYSFSMLKAGASYAYFVRRSQKICAASSSSSRKSFSLRYPRWGSEASLFFEEKSASILRKEYPLENNKNKLIHPWFITGFTDAEGSFMVHLEKNQDKWRVRPRFQIKLDIRDLSLLKEIKAYFNHIGSINISNKECVYKVRSLNEVAIIISHFDEYNLMSEKRADFDLFKLIVNILNNQEQHLTSQGLEEIVNIGFSMNLAQSSLVRDNFSNIIPVARPPLAKNRTIPHPEWIAGFVSGKGSFSIYASQSVNKPVSLSFRVFHYELRAKDEELLKLLSYFFNCGNLNYHEDKKAVIFVIRKFEYINHKIIPFFYKYKVKGIKCKDFKDWSEAAKIIESKNHLTQGGHNEIRRIRKNMNSYRL